ncbi:MAG: hypothetical protein WCP24_01135 [bacterium]
MPPQNTNQIGNKNFVYLILCLIIVLFSVLIIFYNNNSSSVKINGPVVYFKVLTIEVKSGLVDVINTSTATNIEMGIQPYEMEISKIGSEGILLLSGDGDLSVVPVGTISNGAFKNSKLFALLNLGEGGGPYLESYLINIGGNKYISFKETDNTFTFKKTKLPEKIVFPKTGNILYPYGLSFEPIDFTKLSDYFYVDNVKFYILNNSIVTEVPNAVYQEYRFKYPILRQENSYDNMDDYTKVKLNIIFNNNKRNNEIYYGGMPNDISNPSNWYSIVNIKDINSGEYKIIGKTPDNKAVYGYSDPNNKLLRDIYTADGHFFDSGLEFKKIDHNQYSYEEFLSLNPILFWQDDFGNWIRFVNYKIAMDVGI